MQSDATIQVRLAQIERGARNINIYSFEPTRSATLPSFEAGAHIDLHVGNGFVRQYSLINSGTDPEAYVIAVLRDPNGRGASCAFHDGSVVGREYVISAPRNNFALVRDERPVYLFAGGIGITPIINMYRSLKALNRSAKLLYYARTTEDFLYRTELQNDPYVELVPTDEIGLENVPWLREIIPTVPQEAHLYCCGPTIMLNDFRAASEGRNPELVHYERFAALPMLTEARSFQIRLARTGKTLSVTSETTILQACLDAGLNVSYSCEEGICGACEVNVLRGEVDHRDSVRPSEEHNRLHTIMICCSRAASDSLTLDI